MQTGADPSVQRNSAVAAGGAPQQPSRHAVQASWLTQQRGTGNGAHKFGYGVAGKRVDGNWGSDAAPQFNHCTNFTVSKRSRASSSQLHFAVRNPGTHAPDGASNVVSHQLGLRVLKQLERYRKQRRQDADGQQPAELSKQKSSSRPTSQTRVRRKRKRQVSSQIQPSATSCDDASQPNETVAAVELHPINEMQEDVMVPELDVHRQLMVMVTNVGDVFDLARTDPRAFETVNGWFRQVQQARNESEQGFSQS